MAARKSQTRRFLGMLRRTAKSSPAGRTPTEENAIWVAHERALSSTREAAEGAQRITSNVVKQRGALDMLGDRAIALAARAHDLGAGFARITDAFERLGLVALNTGLEGARLGESAGKALLLVSDEVRAHALRGSESARELSSTMAEVGSEISKLHAQIEQSREASTDAAQEAARVSGATAEVDRALVELGERVRKTTGSDPETARAVADASDHAKALVAALGSMSGKVPRSLLLAALRPVLDPLARLLAEDDEAAEEESDG